jgi:hypothetical protein
MRRLLEVLLTILVVSGLAVAQQDRGTFTGIVADETGAVIPGVNVTIVNTATGSRYPTTTTSSGQYTVPGVPIGTYDLIFESPGFNRRVQRKVEIGVAEIRRVDVSLEVGAVTESVEVTAEVPRLQTDAPDVGTSLSNSSVVDLPLAIGGGGRTMENLVYKIVPGTSGDTYRSYIVGTQAWSKASLLDGASVDTIKPGHFGEASVSMEAVQEFKAQTSTVSAEYGRSQGAVFNYVMKSGSNELHGSAYGLLRNEALNANTFANNANGTPRGRDRKWDYALSVGGPVYLPKVYNGRNKTFFYFTWERYHEDNTVYGSPNQTLPVPEFYEGDFSRLLGSKLNFSDALGNPVYKGAIYDPSTFYKLDNGRWIGQMFPGNIVPKSRFSRVAQKMNTIMQEYYLPTVKDATGQYALVNNAYRPLGSIMQRDQKQLSIKGDHNFSDYHKISGSFSLNNRPRFQNGGYVWNQTAENGGPLSAAQWQYLNARFVRFAYDWTVSPTVMNHFMVFYNRNLNDMPNSFVEVDGLAELGISGFTMQGYPIMNWNAGPYVKPTNPGWGRYWFVSCDAGGIQDTLSFSRGRHFVKIGGDWRRNINHYRGQNQTQFNFSAASTAIPFEQFSGNYTGYTMASYLLGIVNSGTLQRHTPFGYIFDYASTFVQDDFKVNDRLTLQLGLRWDYRAPIREKHDWLSSWDYNTIDPVSGLKGAYTFAGDCQGCIGSSYFSPKDWNNFAPRIGFAWRVLPKTTIRASYAIFFQGAGDHGSSLGSAASFSGTPTYAYGADTVNPWAGRHNLDDGIPIDEIYQAPVRDPSWHINNSAGLFDPYEGHMPYIQRWNINIQKELARNLILDVGYLGVKGTGLYGGGLSRVNQLPTSVLQEYGQALTRPVTNEQQAAANGVPYPYPGYKGTVAGALREYPQVRGTGTITNVGNNLGFSNTQSFQAVLDKRFSSGFNAYISYTWQKTLANKGAAKDFDSAVDANYPLDYYNLALEQSVVPYDVPHMFKVYGSYELPFGRGRRFLAGASKPLNAILGGWSVSAILNYMSGQPLWFTGATNPSGWNGATNRLNIAPGDIVSPSFSKNNFNFADTSGASNTYLNKDLFSDPAPYTLGTAAHYYTGARGFGTINEDIGLQKNHRIGEKYRFQIRAEFLNLFNRSTLGGVVGDFRNATFGQVTSISGYRSVQLGVRFDF